MRTKPKGSKKARNDRVSTGKTRGGAWVTRGFKAFSRGVFDNAGQNLYVSRAGVLQRIHLFDLNQDGWLDLVLCNAQDHHESPPVFVYTDVFGKPQRAELPSDGSRAGVVADLNGDGLDDLVLGMEANGATTELHAFVYYGSEEGLTTRYHTRLPAPLCTGVAAGDFNGDGRMDLAMISRGRLRLFHQNEVGFEAKRFVDLNFSAKQITAADLDGDGFCDLYVVRDQGQCPCILWGGPDGINPARLTEVPIPKDEAPAEPEPVLIVSEEEVETLMIRPLPGIIHLGKTPHLFVAHRHQAFLVPVTSRGNFDRPLVFGIRNARAVAVGNLCGKGEVDLVFAARDMDAERECSWVYFGGKDGYGEARRTALPCLNACDVAVGDLDGDGCDDVVLCQYRSEDNFSFHSLAFRGGKKGLKTEPVRLPTEGARRVFIAHPHRDGKPRVLFVNRYGRNALGRIDPAIYWGGADGFREDRVQFLSGMGCVTALGCDVNDDGRPDLVTVNCAENAIHLDPGSFVFFGGERGFSREPSLTLRTHTAMAVACADINRDGYLDLIFSGFNHNELLIFHGKEGGFEKEPKRILIKDGGGKYTDGRRMCLADFNNDGWLDLVITDNAEDRCFILWGGPDGFSFDRKQALSVYRGSAPQAADLTGSGYLDLIIGAHQPSASGPYDSFLYIYWNGPDGLREDRRTQIPIATALNVTVADFNNDGRLDLFVPSYHDGKKRDIDSYIFWGGPDRNFTPERCTPVFTHSAAGSLAADFNEDGHIDLVVANHKTHGDHIGESFVLWNGPDGFNRERITRLPSKGPHGIMFVGPGNQRDRGPEEFYVSEPFQMPEGSTAHKVEWEAELPVKTWVRAQVRTASSRENLERAAWRGTDGENSWFEDEQARRLAPQSKVSVEKMKSLETSGPWVQFRLALGAVNSGNTPRVREVRVLYN